MMLKLTWLSDNRSIGNNGSTVKEKPYGNYKFMLIFRGVTPNWGLFMWEIPGRCMDLF